MLEILLQKNYGNVQICHPSIEGVLTDRVEPEKHLK